MPYYLSWHSGLTLRTHNDPETILRLSDSDCCKTVSEVFFSQLSAPWLLALDSSSRAVTADPASKV